MLAVLVMELPSGYLADRLGRVTVLRLGALFWSSSWLLLLGVNDLFEIFTGLGSSLLSGADLALLYDLSARRRGESACRTGRFATYLSWAWRQGSCSFRHGAADV